MCSKVILGTYKLEKELLDRLIRSFYSNPDSNKVISIDNIEDISKMDLLETPDILFISAKDISEETIEKLDPIRKSMVIFILENDLNKSYIHSICNLVYGSGSDLFPANQIMEPFAKKIRFNKEALSKSKDSINIQSIMFYLDLIDMWDHYTKGHCERTAKYTSSLVNCIDIPLYQKDIIKKSSLIHDFGKIAIPRII
jgi:hypothetical protein